MFGTCSFEYCPCINRNIVECKVIMFKASSELISVLIETLWNVKNGNPRMSVARVQVLIETLWNVKVKVKLPVSRQLWY